MAQAFLRAALILHVTQQAEARRFEEAIVAESKRDGRQGIVALPGVREIMDSVRMSNSPPLQAVVLVIHLITTFPSDRSTPQVSQTQVGSVYVRNVHLCQLGTEGDRDPRA